MGLVRSDTVTKMRIPATWYTSQNKSSFSRFL